MRHNTWLVCILLISTSLLGQNDQKNEYVVHRHWLSLNVGAIRNQDTENGWVSNLVQYAYTWDRDYLSICYSNSIDIIGFDSSDEHEYIKNISILFGKQYIKGHLGAAVSLGGGYSWGAETEWIRAKERFVFYPFQGVSGAIQGQVFLGNDNWRLNLLAFGNINDKWTVPGAVFGLMYFIH